MQANIQDDAHHWFHRNTEFLLSFLLFCGVLQLFILNNYYGISLIPKYSWQPNDAFLDSYRIVGVHHFSDLTSMMQAAKDINPWGDAFKVVYSPALMALLKFFGIFFQGKYTLIILVFFVFCAIAPAFSVIRKHQLSPIYLAYIIGSIPFIAGVDRGNTVMMLPALLFLFYRKLVKREIIAASIWLCFCISIKSYVVVIILFLLVRREYKVALNSLFLTLSLNFFSALIWGNPFTIAGQLLDNIKLSTTEASYAFLENRIGAAGSFLQTYGILFSDDSGTFRFLFNNSQLISIGTLVVLLMVQRVLNYRYWIFLALYSIQVFPDPSYTYTACWTFVALPLLLEFREENKRAREKDKNKKRSKGVLVTSINPTFESLIWMLILMNALPFLVYWNSMNLATTTSYTVFMTWCIYKISSGLLRKKFILGERLRS
jgi:hypothetical protein